MTFFLEFDNLPIEVFEKIIEFSINIKECYINFNKNLRVVCKYWNETIHKIKLLGLY